MDDEDLKSLGLVLDQGQAGPIVVFAPHMADQTAANIKSLNKAVSNEIDANADELAAPAARGRSRPLTSKPPTRHATRSKLAAPTKPELCSVFAGD
ncbi:MAG TPA: hypothetical protein VMU39_04480 [Solirubrobacteraceae bacterium]|nr:hypothetical protein [Solirubrobacteraceae bacterium]